MDFMRLAKEERGDIVLRQIIKFGLIFIFLVFLVAEVGPIVWYRISTIQDAEDVAHTAAADYRTNRDQARAVDAANQKLRQMGYSDEEIRESVGSIEFLPAHTQQKQVIRVTVVRYAKTILTRNIEQLKKYSRIATTREASVSTSEQ